MSAKGEGDTPDHVDDDRREMSEVLAGGVEVIGSLPGSVVGFVLAGPPGAMLGGALTPLVTRALKAAIGAGLAHRARDRAGGAALLIEAERRQREQRGEKRRADGFFDERGTLRPDAEELLEGVLREAAQSFEERKVPLIASLYASVEHDAAVPAADALLLLRRAGQLTYRQFVALSVFEQAERYADFLIQTDAMHGETNGRPGGDPIVQLELSDLSSQQLLGTLDSAGEVVPLGATYSGIGNIPARVGLGQLRLLPSGRTLARLTKASAAVLDQERDELLEALRGPTA